MNFSKLMACAIFTGAFLAACNRLPHDPVSETAQIDGELPSGVRLVERVAATDANQLTIPYAKFELENGLTVILHEDHSDPLVHVDVTYHVGSAREEIGRSGFAHFFEHMMFQGSENAADEQHFQLISESGGSPNGTTSRDRTNYFETVPSNALERTLWLEADRMGFLLPAVTQEKFEIQRATVKNERGQNVDNRPYGRVNERIGEALYPEGHPYSWDPIGYIEDLDRANLDDLKRFFLRWYGPNNAVLTVGGDIDEKQTLDWIVKYFGPIPRGPDVVDQQKEKIVLGESRYISMEDNVSLPMLQIVFPTVYAGHPDEVPLKVLASILGGGQTSLFYKNLVKPGIVPSTSVRQRCGELHCKFLITLYQKTGSEISMGELEELIYKTVSEIETRGVMPEDLEAEKVKATSSLIFGLESVAGRVRYLAAYETFYDNPNRVQTELAASQNVTAEDVLRVYRTYIKDKPAVIMSVVPYGRSDDAVRPDTWHRKPRTIPTSRPSKPLKLRIPKDDFDRRVVPPLSDRSIHTKAPEVWQGTLSNGIEVLGTVNSEMPTTSISIRVSAGQRDEPLDKLGLATITSALLNQTTLKSSNEELARRKQLLGTYYAIRSDEEHITASMTALSDKLDPSLDLLVEQLLEPALLEDDLSRLRSQAMDRIRLDRKKAKATAGLVFERLLYGADNSFPNRNLGTLDTVPNLSLEDVKRFYSTYFVPSNAKIVVVSDRDKSQIMDSLERFARWQGAPSPARTVRPFPQLDASHLYLIDKPGAAQSAIRIGRRALPYDLTGDYYRANLANLVLGGTFMSRINLNIREDKGYTYGVRTEFVGSPYEGHFQARTSATTRYTTETIEALIDEISRYVAQGPTEDEVQFTQRSRLQRTAKAYERSAQRLRLLSNMQTYGVGPEFLAQQGELINTMTPERAKADISKFLSVDEMIIVVVGDKERILSGLETLGRKVVELDENGDPV